MCICLCPSSYFGVGRILQHLNQNLKAVGVWLLSIKYNQTTSTQSLSMLANIISCLEQVVVMATCEELQLSFHLQYKRLEYVSWAVLLESDYPARPTWVANFSRGKEVMEIEAKPCCCLLHCCWHLLALKVIFNAELATFVLDEVVKNC